MARRLRCDIPGATYHVMNRGTARRTIFDTAADFRFFISGLARAVRREEIVVLAYALMRTHFHLYLRSLGGLSVAMQRIQLRHVRRFNRLHRRDGHLLRNRFLSKRVSTAPYERNVVYYVHENPVLARLCRDPAAYPWSSAWLCSQPKVPLWFTTNAIERHGIHRRSGGSRPSEEAMRVRAEIVEARLYARGEVEDLPLDEATPDRVRAWMIRKAELADGKVSALPLVGALGLRAALELVPGLHLGGAVAVPGAGTYACRELMLAGLLRDVCCLSHGEIARKLDVGTSKASRLVSLHRRCVLHLVDYADQVAAVIGACVDMVGKG